MYEPYTLVPLVICFSSLLAADDIAQVNIPSVDDGSARVQIDACDWAFSLRALISGTASLVVKRGDGTTIATAARTSAGITLFRPTVSLISMGDRLRFGLTGVGVGLADVSVTGWLKIPTTM